MAGQDLSGRKFGQYELRERLGRGGMADVYKAFQPGMERFVAVKVMLGHLATDEEFIERFKREARAVGSLRHPHIINVFDFGIEDDVYYMVMEFIKGENLKAYIAHNPNGLPFDDALRIASQIADALSYAHKAGMIYRDVKPANIMFTDDTHEQAILTDFGIAHILSQPGLTASGAMVGTPAYLSPDAAFGRQVDERSDIYGLGIILYEMLTGKVPYDADTPMAVIMKHVNAPLPTRSEYGRVLPDSVETIILKALMKNPEDRYQTADEMKAALDSARAQIAQVNATRITEKITQPSAAPPVQAPPTQAAAPTEAVVVKVAKPKTALGSLAWWGLRVGAVLVVLVLAFLAIRNNSPQPVAELPTLAPTIAPPTEIPTELPTDIPTEAPTEIPTEPPTEIPTEAPTDMPTEIPTEIPTAIPTELPTEIPTEVAEINPLDAPVPSLLSGLTPLQDEIDQLILDDNWDEIDSRLTALLQDDPHNIEALTARSLASSWNGDIDQARTDAKLVKQLAPDSPLGYIALADVYLHYSVDDAKSALNEVQRALELDPGNPEALWRISEAQSVLGNDDAARLAFQRAEAQGAKGFRFVTYAAETLYYADLYERALPYLRGWYQVDPYAYSMTLLVGDLILLKHPRAAYQVVKDYPYVLTEPDELSTAAYAAYNAEDYKQAREWAETALALDDQTYAATYILALVSWYGDSDLSAAMGYFNKLEGVDFYDDLLSMTFGHELNLDRGKILAAAGHYQQAIDAYQTSLDANGDYALGYILMAESYLAMGDRDTARARLRSALDLTDDPEQQRTLLARIRQLGNAGQ